MSTSCHYPEKYNFIITLAKLQSYILNLRESYLYVYSSIKY